MPPFMITVTLIKVSTSKLMLTKAGKKFIDQSECLVCYFLCPELILFCIELPKNCTYLGQVELSNFFLYIIRIVTEEVWSLYRHHA